MSNPTPISANFTKKGFEHRLIKRIGAWCMFERERHGIVHFEVVKPQIAKTRCDDGKWIECAPYELYPPTTSWGTHGFSFTDEDKARERLSALGSK